MKKLFFILLILLTTNLSAETIASSGYNSVTNSGGAWVETLITVDISLHTAITIDMDYGETGTMDKFDQFQIHYRIDGVGAWAKPVLLKSDMAGDAAFSVAGLEGLSLEILVRMKNDDATKTWWYDNLVVAGTGPLPVELLHFTAKIDDTILIFKWATGSEINNDYFSIQESMDGIKYDDIEYIAGAGNSSTMIEYSIVTHIDGSDGIYYRLMQVDFDGTTSYSHIVNVSRKGISNFIIGMYDIRGRPVSINHKGLIIIKYSDGSTKKIINK